MDVQVFFIKPSGRVRRALRRFDGKGPCSHNGKYGYCNEKLLYDYVHERSDEVVSRSMGREDALAFSDKWPTHCAHCRTSFTDDAAYQIFCEPEYVDAEDRQYFLRELPVGACYEANWRREHRVGYDGRSLYVQTPGGLWGIDERARNCTMPEDHEHRCWVRHGSPEDGTIHVDKNGNTCAAGAGSIQCGDYHGFLHNGKLTSCSEA